MIKVPKVFPPKKIWHFLYLYTCTPNHQKKVSVEKKTQWVFASPVWQQVIMCCSCVTTWSLLRLAIVLWGELLFCNGMARSSRRVQTLEQMAIISVDKQFSANSIPVDSLRNCLSAETHERPHNLHLNDKAFDPDHTPPPECKDFRLRKHIKSRSRKLHLNNTMQRLRPTTWCEPHPFYYVHFLVSPRFIYIEVIGHR